MDNKTLGAPRSSGLCYLFGLCHNKARVLRYRGSNRCQDLSEYGAVKSFAVVMIEITSVAAIALHVHTSFCCLPAAPPVSIFSPNI